MPNDTADSKRRQRERNSGSGNTRSGSSGVTSLISRMEKRSYREIAPDAVKGPEFAGQVTDVRVLANRTVSLSIIVPAAYGHEVMDLGFDSATMFTFFRASHVPRPSMLPEIDNSEEDPDDD